MDLFVGFPFSYHFWIWVAIDSFEYLYNYFNPHVCLFLWQRPSVHPPVRRHPVPSHFTIPAIRSQNVNNKSCLVGAKSEKYAFWVTLRLIRSMRQGEAELCKLHYQARRSQATDIKIHFSVSSPPQCSVRPKQLCASAHLGCTRAAGTS